MKLLFVIILLSVLNVTASVLEPFVAKHIRPSVQIDALWRRHDGRVIHGAGKVQVQLTKVRNHSIDTGKTADTVTKALSQKHRSSTYVTMLTGRTSFERRWLSRAQIRQKPKGASSVVCVVIDDERSWQERVGKPSRNFQLFPFDDTSKAMEVERAVGIECTAYYINDWFRLEEPD